MKEQSHKDEMSAAIRGDFQRLRDRGVSATLGPHEVSALEPQPEPIAEEPAAYANGPTEDAPGDATPARAVDEASTDVSTETAEDVEAELEPLFDDEPLAEPEEELAPARSGWLSRLVGR